MNAAEKQNANPTVYAVTKAVRRPEPSAERAEGAKDPIDAFEVFELIRHLNDPEHPLTLEQLNVVQVENVRVDDAKSSVEILFTPTIPHCSMATLIGLCIRVKLLRSLPSRFKTSVRITPGTHQSEHAVNKQLNDKERVAAAMENDHLLQLVNKCLANSDPVDPDEDLEGVRELEDEESARAPLALRAVEEGLLRSVW